MSAWISEGAVDAGMNRNEVKHFENKEDLIENLQRQLKKNDVVIIKGSRSMKMEEVAEALIR
jgi:UDP-N-acetylmuramoyl-tripeptide--D-alanyl-D-alanine ligase